MKVMTVNTAATGKHIQTQKMQRFVSAGIKLAGDSTLVMESGEISGNTGNDSGQASAAGVYISHGGTANFGATQIAGAKFTMNGGSICNNTGTGVTLYDGSNPGEFNMYGGTITGNSGYGVDLVYSTGPFGKFTMKGSAVVTSDNKVFIGFPNGTKIYIADELTGTAPVATIKLNGYNENTEVIALANGVTDTSLLSAACTKIEVAPYNGIPWYLTSDGKITATNPNSGNNSDDFVLVTGSTIDFNIGYGVFRSCETYPITIRNLYVCNHEVTQKEYEQYCIYGTEKDDEGNLGTQYAPTSAHGTGDNFPVYFVSWHDAIVYCNLRSLDEHLTPVYSLPKQKTDPDAPDEYSTKPSEWVDIVTSGDKYCGPNLNYYYDIYSNSWSNWEWISASPGYESVRIDENANGYRLPTTEEWEYFARGGQGLTGSEAEYEHSGAIDDDAIDNVAHHAQYPYGSFNEDSTTFECGKDVNPNSLGLYDLCGNVKEWCFDLVDDDGQRWIIDGVEYDRNAMYTCDRKATIGFRVVRNAN